MEKPLLLVDDSEDDEFLFKRTLQLAGLTNPVIVLRDGESAIEYLRGDGPYGDRARHPLPHILVLDIKMPRKNGFEVLEWINTQPHLKNLLVVMLSGSDRPEDLRASFHLGATRFLTKPCTPADLHNLAADYQQYWTRSGSS